MGSWGTGFRENDDALDLIESVRKSRKINRLRKVLASIESYVSFHERLVSGKNITAPSDADIADLLKSREKTLEWYASVDQPFPIELVPEMKTAETWAAWVAELAKPEVEDGVSEGACLLASADLLDEAIRTHNGPLSHCDSSELDSAATQCSSAIGLLLENHLYADSWSPEDFEHVSKNALCMANRLQQET